PISREGRAIPNNVASRIKLLDVVSLRLAKDRPRDRYQRENYFVESWDWEVVGSVSQRKIHKYCEDDSIVLHSHNDRVDPSYFEKIPFREWKSLQLVRAHVAFERDYWRNNRWRASFKDGSGEKLYLKVDYPEIVEKLERGQEISSKCLLTISLAGPWTPDNVQPERCYKLVAGVIEL
ncbi:MAG TPA: hypothetical protein PLL90_12165, partial [Bacteroidales bacterium]|nr:hypothetical protein [Bacteroidales bacterium]